MQQFDNVDDYIDFTSLESMSEKDLAVAEALGRAAFNLDGKQTEKGDDVAAQGTSANVSIKEAFSKIPIIGAFLYEIFHSILKLFGIDLDKVGQAGGVSLDKMLRTVNEKAPWAADGIQQVIEGLQQLKENPGHFRTALKTIQNGIQSIKTEAEERNLSPELKKALEEMDNAMDRLIKAGPFSALFAARDLAKAGKALQEALETEPQFNKGLGMNIAETPLTEVGEALSKLERDLGEELSKGFSKEPQAVDERMAWRKSALEEGTQDDIKDRAFSELKTGLDTLEKDGASGISPTQMALGDLASTFRNKDTGKHFLEKAQKEIQPNVTADDAYSSIHDMFDKLKEEEEARAREGRNEQEEGKSFADILDNNKSVREKAEAAAKNVYGKVGDTNHDSKTAYSTGQGNDQKTFKQTGM